MNQINNKNMAEEFHINVFSHWHFNVKFRKGWQHLAANHHRPNIFLTIEWLELWWEVYAKKVDVLKLVFIHNNSDVIAIAPFYQKAGKELRFVGTGEPESAEVASEFLDVLIDVRYKNNAAKLLKSYLQNEITNSKLLEFNNILLSSNIYSIVETLKLVSWQVKKLSGIRYFITLPKTILEYYQAIDKSIKSQLLRKKKKFEKLGGSVKRIKNIEELEESFEDLKMLHCQRWQKSGLIGAFGDQRFNIFHLEFMRLMLAKGQLSLTSLIIDNRVIAVIYNIKYRDTRFFYQIGANLTFRPNISAGSLIHLYEIQDSIETGENYYDFMKGAISNSYKESFSNSSEKVFNLSIYKKGFDNFLQLLKYYVLSAKNKIIKCIITHQKSQK